MNQQALFHDSIYDAIAADVAAIGGIKKAAALLWPNHSDAASKLRSCLSVEHAQKLDPEDVFALKRLALTAGSTATITYESQHLSFKIEWLDPQDELGTLMRENSDDFKRIEARQKRLERLLEQQAGRK